MYKDSYLLWIQDPWPFRIDLSAKQVYRNHIKLNWIFYIFHQTYGEIKNLEAFQNVLCQMGQIGFKTKLGYLQTLGKGDEKL